jgi:hypothetical protein
MPPFGLIGNLRSAKKKVAEFRGAAPPRRSGTGALFSVR